LWVFAYLYEWIKARGRRDVPFGLLIDEFVALTQKALAGENPLAVELDEFIQQYMRSSQIWLTIGFQSPHQLDDQLRQTVLSLGTYLIGQAATMEGARVLADSVYLRDPYWVKYWRPVPDPFPFRTRRELRESAVSDPMEPEFMALEEQTEIFANRIRRLKQYQFLVRPAVSEGTISTDVFPINISRVTADPETGVMQFPDRELMGELRSILAAKAGKPINELLQEQETSLERYTHVVEGQLHPPPVIIQRAYHTEKAATPRAENTQPVAVASQQPSVSATRPVKRRIRLS
jgi:hypothetical protein